MNGHELSRSFRWTCVRVSPFSRGCHWRRPAGAPNDIFAFDRAAWAVPVVGALIGMIGAIAFWLGKTLQLGPWIAAILAIATLVALTGALHEDGLADCADGFGGGSTPCAKTRNHARQPSWHLRHDRVDPDARPARRGTSLAPRRRATPPSSPSSSRRVPCRGHAPFGRWRACPPRGPTAPARAPPCRHAASARHRRRARRLRPSCPSWRPSVVAPALTALGLAAASAFVVTRLRRPADRRSDRRRRRRRTADCRDARLSGLCRGGTGPGWVRVINCNDRCSCGTLHRLRLSPSPASG